MTDINKLEELAKDAKDAQFDNKKFYRHALMLLLALPAFISKYRRMEEALRRIENESNQWEPSVFDMGHWACEALKGSGPAQDISALQDQDQ